MADELVLYTNPMSRGRIARWMMEEVGQPYRAEIIAFGANRQPAYLAVNPMGKLPALKHGETIVTEVAAICAYLADAFPQANLAPPPGSKQRGPYYRWLFFAAGPMEQAVTNKNFGFEVSPERKATVGYGSYDDVLRVMEQALAEAGGPWLLGEQFTAADVYFGAHIGWGMMTGALEKRPAFEAYAARVGERPAAKRAKEIDDADTAKMQAAG